MRKSQIISLSGGFLLVVIAGLLFVSSAEYKKKLTKVTTTRLTKEQIILGNSPVIPNKSDILAEVLNVEKGDFPETLLTLQILESRDLNDFYNLLKSGDIIKASPKYIFGFTAGTQHLIFTLPQNIQNVQAYYLLPEDRIRAVARAQGGPGNIAWYITDIVRTGPALTPVPALTPLPAPNRSNITGMVLKVKKKDYPEAELMLKVIESRNVGDFANFLASGIIFTASPYYTYDEGGFIFSENVKNLLAYYLLPGDTIEAEASMCAADNGDIVWLIYNLERINQI